MNQIIAFRNQMKKQEDGCWEMERKSTTEIKWKIVKISEIICKMERNSRRTN